MWWRLAVKEKPVTGGADRLGAGRLNGRRLHPGGVRPGWLLLSLITAHPVQGMKTSRGSPWPAEARDCRDARSELEENSLTNVSFERIDG